jgi:uncharacterized protein
MLMADHLATTTVTQVPRAARARCTDEEPVKPIADRLRALDWPQIENDLSARGYAEAGPVLTASESEELVSLYPDDRRFRHRVDMARHRFGEGDYKYFARPLPEIVDALRVHCYPPLAAVANRWNDALGDKDRFPATLEEFLDRCAARGQTKPTPLMLHYEREGYNCLHQDLYGDVAFPLQVVCFLSRPGIDYTGGEFLLVEQRPRAQSAAEVITGEQGALVVFTTRVRPVKGSRGFYRVNVRHGVGRVRSGTRYTLGVIFHDAK